MKFGMNLLLWRGDLHDDLLPTLEMLKQQGYDGVELPIFGGGDVKQCTRWGILLDELELERTAVTVRGQEDNPISLNAKTRSKGVDLTKRTVDCCQAAGVKTLVGPYHSALGVFSGQGPTAEEWQWGVECMQKVAEHAAACDVTLGVEYLNRFECYFLNCVADTVRFIKDVNHPNCRMMYDTFHANIEEKNIPQAIREAAPYTCHVHISENDRSTPGAGNVRWAETFDTLREVGYDGWCMVEAFGLSLPELVAATKIWRRMYQNEEQLARDALAFMKQEWAKRAA